MNIEIGDNLAGTIMMVSFVVLFVSLAYFLTK